ncbi:tetratricopeptide repeat protein [Leptothermofonsia sichuanensis E412]|uniref:tetratricopeptide repeat protein n=1 Tax=Leptothermofonsia sichuanensis TaxID=2917832 RepID=UPI001CA6BDE1|nr:tetratricopeptide repeat protein [Leptothermofonsia sichuanensis]QZZ18593.1 tetratricopeptide repeat protein [Leptothermofonsia sichuanensis E412]
MPLMPMHPLNHFFLASCFLPLPVGILPLSSLSSGSSALAHPPLAQISEDGKTRADHLLQRGRQQPNAGDYSAAIQTLEQALAAYRAIPDRHGEAQTLNSLGVAFDSLSQPVRAVELYQQALSIFRQVQDREGEAKVLHNLGIAFRSLSQSSKAIEHLQQAFSLYRRIGKLDDAADSLMMLGTVHNDLSRYQEAIKFFQQALTMMRGGKKLF